MRNFVMLLVFGILQGCVSQVELEKSLGEIYNVSTSGESEFDKRKYIRVSKIFCSSVIAFELYQDTPKNNAGVVLLNAGTNTITNIGTGKALLIKIDGEIYSFESKDANTEYDKNYYDYGVTSPFSHKTFIVPESIVRKIASSNEFLVKINLLNNTFVEGKCSPVTLAEYKEANKSSSWADDVKQENIDSANKYTALNGFRKFVNMMDSVIW